MNEQNSTPTEAEIVGIVERAIAGSTNPNALHGMSRNEAQVRYDVVSRVLPHVPDTHKYLVMAYKVRIQREYHLEDASAQVATASVKFSEAQLNELRDILHVRGWLVPSDQERAAQVVAWAYRVAPPPAISSDLAEKLIKAFNRYVEGGERFSQHYAMWVGDSHDASKEIVDLLKPYETSDKER